MMNAATDSPAFDNRVSDSFEAGFMNLTLEDQIRDCEGHLLTSLYLENFTHHQPLLEAGCGSGQWMHFFKRHGIQSTGIDWSEALRARSLSFDPSVAFDNGDMRDLPYPDESFGSVVAMGSPEHVLEGPAKVFQEFLRVMRPGGVAVVTVPHFFFLRALVMRLLGEPARRLKRNPLLRKMLGKPPLGGGNPRPHAEVFADRYRDDIHLAVDFDGYFYEYFFTQNQIREELVKAGFVVEQCFAFNGASGLIFTLGRIAGQYDSRTHQAHLNGLGRSLLKFLTDNGAGHMICCVARKPAQNL
jgi:SAM-dependent methyltransferase